MPIPTHHTGSNPAPSAPSGGHSGGNNSGTSGGSNTGGGGPNSYQSMYRQQKADERAAQRRAAQRYISQAHTMEDQAAALRIALGKKGFRSRLNAQLANIEKAMRQTDQVLLSGYHERVGSLEQAKTDNEKAAAGQTNANLQNRIREQGNALSEAAANGAGESDLLRAQSMSLDNWQANQSEVNRSFFDTLSQVNSSMHDLNVDTRTSRVNNVMSANSDREQVWNSYYDRRSEALTQLGNTYGQIAEYYGLAKEQKAGTGGKQKHASHLSAGAFRRASLASGQGYDSPGVPKKLMQWHGHRDFEGDLNNDRLAGATTEIAPKKPEGAGLRSWT